MHSPMKKPLLRMLRWVSVAPLGKPVVPLLNWMFWAGLFITAADVLAALALATQAGEAMAAQAREAEAALRKEFGAAFDDKIHAARRVLREVADEETIAMLERTGLGNNPGLIKVLAHAAAASSEAPALKGGGDTQISRRLTPADAKAQLSAMEADEETMKRLMDGSHPGHAEAQDRRRRLMADAYPGVAA